MLHLGRRHLRRLLLLLLLAPVVLVEFLLAGGW
jgi:hypothetical protein